MNSAGFIARKFSPELKKNNIYIVDDKNFPKSSKKYLQSYFSDKVVPFIHTVMLDKDEAFNISAKQSIILCFMFNKKSSIRYSKNVNVEYEYAIVEIPSDKTRQIYYPSCNQRKKLFNVFR